MARHSEDECAYCEADLLPLSYLVGADDRLYCSVKCAELAQPSQDEMQIQRSVASAADMIQA